MKTAEMRIADFLRHDAQAYGVPESPSIERILEVCVEAANWIDELEQRLAQAERERDAAVADMRTAFRKCNVCFSCKYDDGESNECMDCIGSCNWQWRGVVEENSKEDKIDEGRT